MQLFSTKLITDVLINKASPLKRKLKRSKRTSELLPKVKPT